MGLESLQRFLLKTWHRNSAPAVAAAVVGFFVVCVVQLGVIHVISLCK
jgi:hypothetical protein